MGSLGGTRALQGSITDQHKRATALPDSSRGADGLGLSEALDALSVNGVGELWVNGDGVPCPFQIDPPRRDIR